MSGYYPPGPGGPPGPPGPPGGTNDPLRQFLGLALTGFGYNFYSSKNQARSDDLLVRSKASGYLSDAENALIALAGEFQRRYIPPLSREHPEPPREAMAALDDLRRLQEEVSTLETLVRGMAVPTADRIWDRFRSELTTLRQLMQFDLDLVRGTQSFAQQAANAIADTWGPAPAHEMRAMLRWLQQVAQAREQFLRMPM